jgi:hypothetical protein
MTTKPPIKKPKDGAVQPESWAAPLEILEQARRLGLQNGESGVALLRVDRDRDG